MILTTAFEDREHSLSSDEVFAMEISDDRTLIVGEKTPSNPFPMELLIMALVLISTAVTVTAFVMFILMSPESPSPNCQLSPKPTLTSHLGQNGTLFSKTFSTDAILKSDQQFIDVVVNLTIKFSSSTNDSSKKAIIVECGDISKVLMTSKRKGMEPILENAIMDRFGSDFNRVTAPLDESFPLEFRLQTSVCNSILQSKGKLLLADEIERSWYRRKTLALEDSSWSDNVTIHWLGFNLNNDQAVSCIITKERSYGDCSEEAESP